MPSPTRKNAPVLVLFRHDLRMAANGALAAAAASGRPVIPVFILETGDERFRARGAASLWWMHHSLVMLGAALAKAGAPLVFRRGIQREIVASLVNETGAACVFWNRRHDPAGMAADSTLKAALKEDGIEAQSFAGQLLHEPWSLKTGSGGPYKVFTPFWKALDAQLDLPAVPDAPRTLTRHDGTMTSETLDDWRLLPTQPDWAKGFHDLWTPGEAGAQERLESFLSGAIKDYAENRDRPDMDGTSRLSPHLAHGEITPAQIFHAIRDARPDAPAKDIETFRKEIGWREFSYHLLFHNPDLADANFNPAFDAFSWEDTPDRLDAWQKGRTGYPLVDAGMRQLWQTGWMHNRVRMAAASFLIKHLRTDWRAGEQWFWDTLVDADPASNAASWQWVAGSGADAAPYFRIFNPILQGRKFDPDGTYVRRFVPELSGLAGADIQFPADAKPETRKKAGVQLGDTYPKPLVDHAEARDSALEAYREMKGEA
ncbi:MAG: deoxyribodipyrimidine photo-lyase [Notoacmeibacter sp.]|nr:deoxyribodipyrimidine photo-lyase [Notoacmeibacter sp.]MCC0031799.1 deoxyribodipyrimidine photo-lyase [Brucellaceae bacterium]